MSSKIAYLVAIIILIVGSGQNQAWAVHSQAKTNQITNEPLNPLLIDPGSKIERNTLVTDRPTIALALGGGGIRGAAHVGVLRVLLKEAIPIDYIAGCSMGSIVGGLYCAGLPLDDIEKALKDNSLQKAYAPGWIAIALLMCPLRNVTAFLTFKDKPYAGLFSGKKFRKFLNKRLTDYEQRIENTKPPFVAVVTNLIDGKAYKLAKGDLADCILASSAVPPLVRPMEIEGNLYVDGAIRSNLPVVSARQFGADIVIAVPVDEILRSEPAKNFRSVRNVATRVTDIVLSVVDEHHLQKADLAIKPDIRNIPMFTKKKKYIPIAIKAGEDAAYAALPAIREAMQKAQLKISNQSQKSLVTSEETK
jgi:NTE family protein